jgi:hypothetical protein
MMADARQFASHLGKYIKRKFALFALPSEESMLRWAEYWLRRQDDLPDASTMSAAPQA